MNSNAVPDYEQRQHQRSTALPVGRNFCLCTVCHKLFRSVAAFDKHRTGSYPDKRRCLTDDEMTAAGMVVNGAGMWVTAAYDVPAEGSVEILGY